MKRRKKPRAPSAPRERDPAEASGIYPYLLRFLEWSASRGYAEQTRLLRENAIRRFIRWCGERSIDRPQDVTRPVLERYRRHLYHYRKENGEALSFATQQQRLLPLRAFFKWLAKETTFSATPPRSSSCRACIDACRGTS
jgi:integrase/recombinase XerD